MKQVRDSLRNGALDIGEVRVVRIEARFPFAIS